VLIICELVKYTLGDLKK